MAPVGLALGNWYAYPGMSMKDLTECAVHADAWGFHSVWTVELFRDAFSPLMAFAAHTKQTRLATGILNIYGRSPVVTLWELATLDEVSGRRAILGLGVARKGINLSWHTSAFDRPLDAMRDYVRILRETLATGKCSYEGAVFSVKDYALKFRAPRKRVPIFVAAMGPRMIGLAAELGDGVLLFPFSLDYVRKVATGSIAEGLRCRATGAPLLVAAYLPCCIAKDRRDAVKAARRLAASYMSIPYFAGVIAQTVGRRLVRQVSECWGNGDTAGALSLVPDSIAERLIVCGTPKECRAQVAAFRRAGIQLPILYPREVGPKLKADILFCVENMSA